MAILCLSQRPGGRSLAVFTAARDFVCEVGWVKSGDAEVMTLFFGVRMSCLSDHAGWDMLPLCEAYLAYFRTASCTFCCTHSRKSSCTTCTNSCTSCCTYSCMCSYMPSCTYFYMYSCMSSYTCSCINDVFLHVLLHIFLHVLLHTSSATHRLHLSLIPSLFNRLDNLPSALQLLLPQADSVIPTRYSQDIPSHTPAHPPHHNIQVQLFTLPRIRIADISTRGECPYPDRVIL